MYHDDHKRRSFLRLALKRLDRALHEIRLIANLSNIHAYECHPNEARWMIRSLKREIANTERRFAAAGSKGDDHPLGWGEEE